LTQKILIIIPAFNEEEAIFHTLESLHPIRDQVDVLVINDGSEDHTVDVIKAYNKKFPQHPASFLNLPFNCGIGAAMQSGFLYAERGNYDYAVQFDADGQHPAERIMDMINYAKEFNLDLCVGSRFLDLNSTSFKSTFLRRLGIRFFAWLISFLTHEDVTDPTSGFRVYGRHAISVFSHTYPDDYPEPESLFWCFRNKLRVQEMPVEMNARKGGKSSIRSIKTLYYMIKVTVAILVDRLRKKEFVQVDR